MQKKAEDQTLLVFVDEKTEDLDSAKRWIAGCCLFGREPWLAYHGRALKVGMVRKKRRLEELSAAVDTLGGVSVLVYADVPYQLIPRREIDGTTDIRAMSRTDNIWSQIILSGITAAIAWLQHSKLPLRNIEIFYDRKDLRSDHRYHFETILYEYLPKWAQQAAVKDPAKFSGDASSLRVMRIQGVEKPQKGHKPDPIQVGTSLADHLCRQSAELIRRGTGGRILVRDHTTLICEITSKFNAVS